MEKKFYISQNLFICIILALSIYIVYGQVGNYDFITLDDNEYVYENTYVQKGLTLESIKYAFTNTSTNLLIPVTWLSFIADYELFGLNSGKFHRTNVIFHIANAILLFLLFSSMTGARWKSVFLAGFFAMHPLQVESVAWITERKDVLSIFFMLIALLLYKKYVEKQTVYRYCSVLLSYTLGLLAKPMIVTFPFVLLILDYWPLKRFSSIPKKRNENRAEIDLDHPGTETINIKILMEKVPFFVLSCLISVITLLSVKKNETLTNLNLETIVQQLSISLVSYVTYIKNIVWPRNLAIFYPHDSGALPPWGSFLLLLFITIIVILLRKWYPYILSGWLWFIVTLVPVIGIFQTGTQSIADRFTYMPIIGIFTMFIWFGSSIVEKKKYQRVVTVFVTISLLIIISIASWLRIGYWQDSITLFSHAAKITSSHWLAHNSLGNGYYLQNNLSKAAEHYKLALSIKPDYYYARYNLARVYGLQRNYAEASKHFKMVLDTKPNFADAHYNLAVTLVHKGEFNEAIKHYTHALKINPNLYVAHFNLARIYESQDNSTSAEQHYTQALLLNPDIPEAHYYLGNIYAEKGNPEEAVKHYKKALQSNPDYAEALNNLGNVLEYQGKYDEAVAQYYKALDIKPDNPVLHRNLGGALKKLGKIKEAEAHLRQAKNLDRKTAQ